jgi:translin
VSKKRKNINNLDEIADRIRGHLSEKDAAREICLKTCREIIRLSSTSIRATHRQNKKEALKLIDSASTLVHQIKRDFKQKHSDLLSANYVHDSFKEYAEASITYSIIFNRVIPDPDELGVAYPAYLNGLAESVGELRRYVLDGLRTGQYSAAEDLLEIMDHIYSILVTMDFPDAITYGLRRNTDSTRGIIEKTRSELTLIQHNNVLQQKINVLSSKLSNSTDPV